MINQFIGGVNDGAEVPEQFWILAVISVEQYLSTGDKIVYHYEIEDDKNWHLKGQEYVCEE